ncbi:MULTISPECIES: DUF5330 domain-containing protein [unclassified Roseitalea]|uniref:DUF5330 domain-containing protein n=1 Tax=unclassified Roseitalea TaxID=2639107 RepID=UPI00273F081F|nr:MULTISPECIES: DUF5330 domain-containing protein [unclassified Roseitalea]
MIGLLLRTFFWAFVALVALPSFVSTPAPEAAAEAPTLDRTEASIAALQLAGGLTSDLGEICHRQPMVCESGRALADATLARAREGLAIARGVVLDAAPSGTPQP